jgi:hypothetical protein
MPVVPVIAAVTPTVLIVAPPLPFGYLKKNRAVDEIHLSRAFFETENRVGAKASYR